MEISGLLNGAVNARRGNHPALAISSIYWGKGALVAAGTMIWACAQTCLGASWEYMPFVSGEVGYEDNLNMNAVESDSGYQSTLSGNIGLRRLTETSRVQSVVRAEYVDRSGTADEKSELNQSLNLLASRNLSELNQISLNFQYDHDYTGAGQQVIQVSNVDPVAGEDEELTPPERVDTDVGYVNRQVRRNRFSIAPSWIHSLTELTYLQLDYRYLDQRYGNSASQSGLNDYSVHSSSITLGHHASERNTIFSAFEATYYETDGTNQKYDSYFARVGIQRQFSSTTDAGLTVGIRQLKAQDQLGNDDTSYGGLLRIGGTKKTERGAISFSLERTLSPSGSGDMTQSDIGNFRWRYGLSQRTMFLLVSSYVRNDRSDSIRNAQSRTEKYVHLEPVLRRRLTETWSVDLKYRYRWKDDSRNPSDTDSNGIFLSINFQPLSEFGSFR